MQGFGIRREWFENREDGIIEIDCKHGQIQEMSDGYMKDESDSFRKRLISVISELSEEQLAVLAEIAERIVR